MNQLDSTTTKYLIHAKIAADGVIDKPDVVGAIFGQTEGLLGDELDLRDLQKSGRIGRIEVEINSKKGKSEGTATIPSSLDQVETAILASSLETIDRIGPCRSTIEIINVEDVRLSKRAKVIEKAKILLNKLIEDSKNISSDIMEAVRGSIQVDEIKSYGKEKLPAGPNVDGSDAIIVVEGRSDIINLLKSGIKNTIAVEGTNIPDTIKNLSKSKTVTVFVDGDRGGELILRELLQVAEIDYVARAPMGQEVEELSQKQIMKCLRNKISLEQYLELYHPGEESSSANNRSDNKENYDNNINNHHGNSNSRHEAISDSDEHGSSGTTTVEHEGFASQSTHSNMPSQKTINNLSKAQTLPPVTVKVSSHDNIKPALSSQFDKYRKFMIDIKDKHKARFLDSLDNVIKEIDVKDLMSTITNENAAIITVIFDGIITQNLLDISESKGIKTIVGRTNSSITRIPETMKLIYMKDLGL